MTRRPLLAYFGHHKCATSWIVSIIGQVCKRLSLKHTNVHNPNMFNKDLNIFVANNDIQFLSYTNAQIEYVAWIDEFVGFHVIRDPRDIVISAYFSHLYSHSTDNWPALLEHRERLQRAAKDEGLFLEMDFLRAEFEDLFDWDYSLPNVMEIKMEHLIQSPYEAMVKVMSFLKLVDDRCDIRMTATFLASSAINSIPSVIRSFFPRLVRSNKIPVQELLAIVYANRFTAKAEGRSLGQEDTKSHYRKGIPGDWVNHFAPEHRDYFKKYYNDLLLKLGYEKNPDW